MKAKTENKLSQRGFNDHILYENVVNGERAIIYKHGHGHLYGTLHHCHCYNSSIVGTLMMLTMMNIFECKTRELYLSLSIYIMLHILSFSV